jgi:rubrerythrin
MRSSGKEAGKTMSEDRLIITDGECDTAQIAEYEATRRDAVRRGLLAGGAIVAASSIPLLLNVRNAFGQASGDAAILEAAVGLEQTAVVAYDTAAGALPQIRSTARLFRDQEQEHADGLAAALEDLGGTPPEPPEANEVKGLSAVKSVPQALTFAVELENMAVIAYIDAHRKLKSPALLKTGAQIMANEGQHLVVLRQALGATPAESVPSAFEAGTDPAP